MKKEVIDDIHQILIAVSDRRERVAEQIRAYDATGVKPCAMRNLMVDAVSQLDDIIGRISGIIKCIDKQE